MAGWPRCCRTHTLEVRSLVSQGWASTVLCFSPLFQATWFALGQCLAYLDVSGALCPEVDEPFKSLSADELAELAKLHASSSGDSWMMIVGGEHGGRMRPDYEGTRPGPYLAGHCSLQWIGRVYSRLLPFFGQDRVIVVAQLKETLQWLTAASADEQAAQRLAGRASLLPMLRKQLAEVQESCRDLIAHGGAHYDGEDVNPATVLQVLRGDAPPSKPCVPKHGVRSVLLIFVSHGHAHPAGPGSKHHEWYMHLPYPVPESQADLYDVVSHEGFRDVDPHPDWDWGAPKHRWRLYSQMLFQAYHSILEQSPQRRLVVFHQFCLSGGVVEFMRRPSYRTYFGTQSWPVFAVTTAGCFEPALGSFVGIWCEELAAALQMKLRRSGFDICLTGKATKKCGFLQVPNIVACQRASLTQVSWGRSEACGGTVLGREPRHQIHQRPDPGGSGRRPAVRSTIRIGRVRMLARLNSGEGGL